jgi:hypothetical protein
VFSLSVEQAVDDHLDVVGEPSADGMERVHLTTRASSGMCRAGTRLARTGQNLTSGQNLTLRHGGAAKMVLRCGVQACPPGFSVKACPGFSVKACPGFSRLGSTGFQVHGPILPRPCPVPTHAQPTTNRGEFDDAGVIDVCE